MACTDGRVLRPELLDFIPAADGERSLRDLVRINRIFGGHRLARSLFRALEPAGARFTVLDVGAASGDMGAAIRSAFPGARITSLDRVPYHMASAAPPRVSADALALPFRPRSFDYVVCSLFMHHFPNERLVVLLRSLLEIARRAVVVMDLERTPLLYYALPFAGAALRWSPVTLHDARRSVQAAFRPAELEALARAAGAARFRVRRHLSSLRLSLLAVP